MQHFEASPEGRPSKRDRHETIRFRGKRARWRGDGLH